MVENDGLVLTSRPRPFLASGEVREHFFDQGGVPHIAFVIEYRLPAPSAPDGSSGKVRPGQSFPETNDLRATLPPETRELFDLLRRWRSATAREDAVPAYVVLTNRQLGGIARERPATKNALMKIEGLGQKKAERHADAILAIIAGANGAGSPATAP